jgi:hypothetical protein
MDRVDMPPETTHWAVRLPLERKQGTGECTTEVADATAVGFIWNADSECPGADVCIHRVTGRLPWEGPDEVYIHG